MTTVSVATLIVGAWMILQGILHDIFVLRSEHGRQYDRNLLRLLMDGHILITCGVTQMIAAFAFPASWAYYIAASASVSLLIYCVMIYPFLKSFATMAMNTVLLVVILVSLLP